MTYFELLLMLALAPRSFMSRSDDAIETSPPDREREKFKNQVRELSRLEEAVRFVTESNFKISILSKQMEDKKLTRKQKAPIAYQKSIDEDDRDRKSNENFTSDSKQIAELSDKIIRSQERIRTIDLNRINELKDKIQKIRAEISSDSNHTASNQYSNLSDELDRCENELAQEERRLAAKTPAAVEQKLRTLKHVDAKMIADSENLKIQLQAELQELDKEKKESERKNPSDSQKIDKLKGEINEKEKLIQRLDDQIVRLRVDAQELPILRKNITHYYTIRDLSSLDEISKTIDDCQVKKKVLDDHFGVTDTKAETFLEKHSQDEIYDVEEESLEQEMKEYRDLISKELGYNNELDKIQQLPLNNQVAALANFMKELQKKGDIPNVLLQNYFEQLDGIKKLNGNKEAEIQLQKLISDIKIGALPTFSDIKQDEQIAGLNPLFQSFDKEELKNSQIAEDRLKERRDKLISTGILSDEGPKPDAAVQHPTTVVTETSKDNLVASKAAAKKDQNAHSLPTLSSGTDHSKDLQKIVGKLNVALEQRQKNKGNEASSSAPTIKAKS